MIVIPLHEAITNVNQYCKKLMMAVIMLTFILSIHLTIVRLLFTKIKYFLQIVDGMHTTFWMIISNILFPGMDYTNQQVTKLCFLQFSQTRYINITKCTQTKAGL